MLSCVDENLGKFLISKENHNMVLTLQFGLLLLHLLFGFI